MLCPGLSKTLKVAQSRKYDNHKNILRDFYSDIIQWCVLSIHPQQWKNGDLSSATGLAPFHRIVLINQVVLSWNAPFPLWFQIGEVGCSKKHFVPSIWDVLWVTPTCCVQSLKLILLGLVKFTKQFVCLVGKEAIFLLLRACVNSFVTSIACLSESAYL